MCGRFFIWALILGLWSGLSRGAVAGAAELRGGYWPLDGTLRDQSGGRNDGYAGGGRLTRSFAEGRRGQGLVCDSVAALIPDSPELRLAPGLRIECWVKLTAVGRSWQPIVIKEGEYQLRVDSAVDEGGHFSFFPHLGGWEPRVRSGTVARVGVWYHVAAGWDGEQMWIEVDGERASRPRGGQPFPTDQPVQVGRFDGVLDELRIDNPAASATLLASWPLDGDLRDVSGNGHDFLRDGVRFASADGLRGLAPDAPPLELSSRPGFQLSPGVRLDCRVYFEQLPTEQRTILSKDGEYLLRLNSPKEGSDLAFFANLAGWEPRVRTNRPVQAGVWYHISAQWTGLELLLDVNGERSRQARRGLARPTDNPLRLGPSGALVARVRLENPRRPALRVTRVVQDQGILRAGRPERLTVTIQNFGKDAEEVSVAFRLPPGIECLDDPTVRLGPMPNGAETTVTRIVQATAAGGGPIEIAIAADGTPFTARHPLAFFAAVDPGAEPLLVRSRDVSRAPPTATTYYVDSRLGSNDHSGTSPESPWRDFSNINGRTLGPGDRLLIRRGSVIHQELAVSARGTADSWAQIGAYGSGARPIIRRNWDLADRCAVIHDPDYLRISSLVVSHAGKGLVVAYRQNGHRGLVIEDCLAHHIEGLYRPNSHGIPEWRDREGPADDLVRSSVGIAVVGAAAEEVLVRDCEMFQCSWGFFVKGDGVIVDRVYCHDNYVRNTSPHPALVSAYRSYLTNSVFSAAGWHASAGTMGIMLVDPVGLIIRNCTFRNQPDSASHDQGGIDFEARGHGCLIERCTFENNAGAAIEVLGLKSPQTTNIEIRDSQFRQNNWADKLGPSEIFIWGRSSDPAVCCSNGLVHNNGYVTRPGVEFFINEAPTLADWTLRDNTGYASVAELQRAMPLNQPPQVSAGPDGHGDRLTVELQGRISDDGLPGPSSPVARWELLDGPGDVAFADPASPQTTARFETRGDYVLRLVADDGQLWTSDRVHVHVLAEGETLLAGWGFNTVLDKEGWSEFNTGTTLQHWKHELWPTTAHPVKYVAGGYYILAIQDSPDAHLLSPDQLGLELTDRDRLTIRFQNHTPATRMRLRFRTENDTGWDHAPGLEFEVVPNDCQVRTYTLWPGRVPGWQGRLRQLRLDLATGTALTGTCRIDYLHLHRPAAE